MRRKLGITVAALVIAAGIAFTIWRIITPTYDETVAACQKAIGPSSTKTHRPAACEGLTADDYSTLLISWTLKHTFDDMPKADRDALDYYDNGTIDGSLG